MSTTEQIDCILAGHLQSKPTIATNLDENGLYHHVVHHVCARCNEVIPGPHHVEDTYKLIAEELRQTTGVVETYNEYMETTKRIS